MESRWVGFFLSKESDHEFPKTGNPPGMCVCPVCERPCTRASPLCWKLSRNLPKPLRPGQGNSRIRLSSSIELPVSAAPPQAPSTCSLSRTDTQQKGQIKSKPQSHHQLSLSCPLNPVPAVDDANTPPHQSSARGRGHLGVPGTAARGAPPWLPNRRPLLSAAPGLTSMVSALSGRQGRVRSLGSPDSESVPPPPRSQRGPRGHVVWARQARAGAWELWSPRRVPLRAAWGSSTGPHVPPNPRSPAEPRHATRVKNIVRLPCIPFRRLLFCIYLPFQLL